MAITDSWLRSITGKSYSGKPELTYRDGVGVRISPKGKVTWIYRVHFYGKPIKMKLGEYPAMKIRDALRLRDEKLELISHGIDPRKSIAKEMKPVTLNEIIKYWIDNHAVENVKQWYALQKMFNKDVSPFIGEHPVASLELSDYMPVFLAAKKRVSAKHSANLMSRLKQVISYAVRHGLIQNNVISELKKRDVGLPTDIRRGKQNAKAVPILWSAIDKLSIHESNRNFLKLNTIFANRPNELRLSKKADFDLNERVWTVPKENNKIGKKVGTGIRRPIPQLAFDIIEKQMKLWPNFKIMFPGVIVQEDRPMSANTPVSFGDKLGELMFSMGYPRTTNHDMRRTARNIWEAAGVDYNVGETMLGHKVHKGVQSHYLDYDYLEEQREAYDMWCELLIGNE